MALFGKRWITPAGKQVFEIPFALTVTDKNKGTGHEIISG
jgi:hypothetical protein